MIHFVQHIPEFGDGKPYKHNYRTVENMLKDPKIQSYLKYKDGLTFAYSDNYYEQNLMVSSTKEKWYFVVGHVDGVKLSDYLPHYDRAYLLNGPVKIVKVDQALYIVMYEYEHPDGRISYLLCELTTGRTHLWRDAEKCEFVRYATQEELDFVNGVTSEKSDKK